MLHFFLWNGIEGEDHMIIAQKNMILQNEKTARAQIFDIIDEYAHILDIFVVHLHFSQ